MSKKDFVSGAAILGAAGIMVKLMGFFFRIPLGRMIGAGGMGDYAPAYDVYAFVLVIATAGIPVAVSKLVAERVANEEHENAWKVFDTSRIIMWTMGILGFMSLFFGAGFIAEAFNLKSSELAIRVISPTLLFAPIMSSYRGYFQGLQIMKPTAISQTIEQLFRVFIGLAAAYALYKGLIFAEGKDVFLEAERQSRGAAGACFGAAGGAAFGLLAIFTVYLLKRKQLNNLIQKDENTNSESRKELARKIAVIAAPITLAACIMPIVNLADVAIVMRRLTEAGVDYETAKAMFGELTSFAAPIISFPQILIQAIAVGLVPLVAADRKRSDKSSLQQDITLGYRVTIILAMPCAAGIFALAGPVMMLFYGDQVDNAIPCLRIYAVAFMFLSLTSITTAMLQGAGRQNIPLMYLLIGLAIKVAVTWTLSGISIINVKGAAIGTTAAYITASLLDMRALRKCEGIRINIGRILGATFIFSVVMGMAAFFLYKAAFMLTGSLVMSVSIAVMSGIVIYIALLMRGHVVTSEDMILMPFGEKLIKLSKGNSNE